MLLSSCYLVLDANDKILCWLCSLFTFPTKLRDSAARERWKKAVNRADPKQPWSLLEPSVHMGVCSVHFVDGMPTAQHPDPTLHLGCDEEPHIAGNRRYKKKPYASGNFVVLENKAAVDDVFMKQKLSCLSKIDLSKKGSIDEAVTGIVIFINHCDQYFTTSSCSGRIYIYEEVYSC